MKRAFSLCFLTAALCSGAHESFAQWVQQPFPSTETLLKVRFVDETTGWIVGGLGHIYKTTDGGTTWIEQDSWAGGGWTLYALSKDTVLYDRFLSTPPYPEEIRRTTDGGITWETADSAGDSYVLYDEFEFVDRCTGFVVGETDTGNGSEGIVRKTTDAGETWTTIWVQEDVDYGFTGLSFTDEVNGWMCSYLGRAFKTTDGGYTWSEVTSFVPGGPTRDIQFTSIDSGWAVGGIGGGLTVSRTTDAGNTWTYYYANGGSSLREIEMLNSQVGWFAGSVNLPPYIARTTDGGETWETQNTIPQHFGFESIDMVNEHLGYAVGDQGDFYKTTNGGVTSVEPQPELPTEFRLEQNYPNPFNPKTDIGYQISDYGFVELVVYDLLGREVATLVNERKAPGRYSVTWDASGQASGVYIYRLSVAPLARRDLVPKKGDGNAGSFTDSKKLVVLK